MASWFSRRDFLPAGLKTEQVELDGNTVQPHSHPAKTAAACPTDVQHRQVKYLNNVVEADHGKLKQLIKPVRGFKTMKAAYATIKGFEVMLALRKGQSRSFNLTGDINGEVRMIERAFGLGPCALTEAMSMLELRLAA